MKKPKIKMTLTKEETGFSACAMVDNNFIATEAETSEELLVNIVDAVNLTFEKQGFIYTIEEIQLEYDLESLFDVINEKAFSERIGMKPSLLSEYIKGAKKLPAIHARRIFKGLSQIGKEYCEIKYTT